MLRIAVPLLTKGCPVLAAAPIAGLRKPDRGGARGGKRVRHQFGCRECCRLCAARSGRAFCHLTHSEVQWI